VSGAARARPAPARNLRAVLDRFLIESNGAIFLALIGLVVFFTLASPNQVFLSPLSIKAMVMAGSSIMIVAVGVTFVLVAGHIDLSIGSVIVLSGVVGIDVITRLVNGGTAPELAIAAGVLVTLAVGLLAGLLNGLVITRVRIPSFIVTLGTLSIYLGIAQLISVGPLSRQVPEVMTDTLGYGTFLGVPWPVVIAVVISSLAWVVLSQTRVGLACYALGSNREAARRAGVPVLRLVVTVFVLMGLCDSIAAVVDMARFTTVSVAGYTNTALAAIAAVIIGGTSLFGGRGTITGTAVGVSIPVVLLSGLVILRVDPFWQNIVIGVMLIVAVGFDQYQRDRISRGLDTGAPPEAAVALPMGGLPQAEVSVTGDSHGPI
jgi:ribose transport system permease protein